MKDREGKEHVSIGSASESFSPGRRFPTELMLLPARYINPRTNTINMNV